MRRTSHHLRAAITSLAIAGLLGVSVITTVQADVAVTPSLVISQLKITSSNGQFVTLYNTTNAALDMSKYQLEYFNSYDLSKATSSRLISLQGSLPPHSYYQINDNAQLLCYQLTINSQSLGFSSTAGFVGVLAINQSTPGGGVNQGMQDFIGWSKAAATGAQTLPANTNAFLQRQPVDSYNNPAISISGAGNWLAVQPDPAKPCNLLSFTAPSVPVQAGLSQLLPSVEPPATILPVSDDTEAGNPIGFSLPDADIGLMAPKITELLPNPIGTANDATNEFIELYNPNSVPFDLSGFVLQTGLTSLKSYVFPAGTTLPPQSFVAYYSKITGLSLSNTTSTARVLDASGSVVTASEPYNNAKDGQSWALANGTWIFTTYVTPNAANIIKQPVTAVPKKTEIAAVKPSAQAKEMVTNKTKTKAEVKSKAKTKTAKAATPKKAKKLVTKTAGKGGTYDTVPKTPIHTQALALVVGLAVLYGAYEYRADIANRIYQLRRYVAYRRTDR